MALISVTISGNAAPLRNELNKAEGLFGKFGGAVTKIAAASAAAFAGLAAGLALATKAAAEDQQSFEQLRIAIKNTTGATDAMVQAIDDQILKMSIAVGVADDQLRPAFGNLVRATGDATKAQDLLSTALDISAATGKPLEAVSIALAKAANGQVTALTRLGVPLDENAVKAKDFDAILSQLNETFGGAAAANADTFAGKMARLRVVAGEVVETIGGAVLPIVSNLATLFLDKVVPAFQTFSDVVGPKLNEAFALYASIIQEKVVPVIQEFLIPAFQRIASIFLEYIVPAIRTIAIPIFEGLVRIFDLVVTKIRENRESFARYADVLGNVWQFIRDKVAPVLAVTLRIAFEVAARAIGFLLDAFFKILPVFTSVVNGVVKIASRIVDVVVGMVNGVISAVNLLVRGFNALPSVLRFGVELSEIPKISLSGAAAVGGTGGDGQSFGGMLGDNRGSMPSVITPSIGGSVTTVDTGGGGGGGGGGRGSRNAPESTNVTVNVNGALATKAEIGDAVIQAIRASNAIYGPFIASAF